MEITSTIDGKVKVVSEASIRRHLKLEDSDGISTLPTLEIFEQLALIGLYIASTLTQKLVSNMKRTSKGYIGCSIHLTTTNFTTIYEKTHVAEEAANMPHDSPLPGGHTPGSDEGSMTLNELTVLCTQLSTKVASLEADLKQTKKVYGNAYTKLIIKVKKLEHKGKSSKSRRRAKIMISDDEDYQEDPSKQGRKIAQIDKDKRITLVQMSAQTQGRYEHDFEEPNFEFTAPEEDYTTEPDISTANVPVSSVGPELERHRLEEALRLQKQIDEEERQRIVRVQEEASTFNTKEWDNIQDQIKADEELALRLQAQEREGYSEANKARLLHIGIHTLQQLKKLSFDEIKELFEITMKRVNTFTPMESDDTVSKVVARSSKRDVEQEINQESSKRQKIGEGSEPTQESKAKESDELSQEQLQQLIIIVPEEGMNVEALQTKYPIIESKVYTGDSRKY
ncbi:hypothetical protein Tco_0819324 [Tanacetum coccineum]|uniref:Uncharacterized protein n=1 Tax=Tanacetum coccineum TaxID=301880 RepID=A0ABQ5A685_9ASTR